MWPSPCSARYLSISRTRRISSLSAGIPFLPRHHRRKELHTGRTPTPHPVRRGRHHLGTRGRLILGIGGRDHFGIRGRIASEFALQPDTTSSSPTSWASSNSPLSQSGSNS
ncbi:hypothetical protein EXN23_19035 [Agrobacterium salinitolerans]|uniref:Uncharacterized protein n=2 Tax=Rhizobium/Agrobacterium group TaxID=227290 RepID=A0A546X653_RHIRH|nr:hypothetical protein EXN23_19035 [Agrobacterium salinitolerans]TRA96223.1 hypothetical protein EXN68_23870 [Rhizobium rhizogenes]